MFEFFAYVFLVDNVILLCWPWIGLYTVNAVSVLPLGRPDRAAGGGRGGAGWVQRVWRAPLLHSRDDPPTHITLHTQLLSSVLPTESVWGSKSTSTHSSFPTISSRDQNICRICLNKSTIVSYLYIPSLSIGTQKQHRNICVVFYVI